MNLNYRAAATAVGVAVGVYAFLEADRIVTAAILDRIHGGPLDGPPEPPSWPDGGLPGAGADLEPAAVYGDGGDDDDGTELPRSA